MWHHCMIIMNMRRIAAVPGDSTFTSIYIKVIVVKRRSRVLQVFADPGTD